MANIDPALAQQAAQTTRTALPVAVSPGALTAPIPQPTADATKVAQLQAGAVGGQAGIDAYKSAQQTLDQLQAAALANAQERARIIGGPEAQGFEALAGNQYNQNRAALATSNAAAQNLQAQNRAAFAKYFGQLKGDMGAINDYIKNTLGSYEAKKRSAAAKRAAAKGYDDEILGEVELGLPEAISARDLAKSELDKALVDRDQLKKGYLGDPGGSRDVAFTFGEQAKGIRQVMERDTKTIYSKNASAADKKFAQERYARNKARLEKVEGLSKAAQEKAKASYSGDLSAAEKRVAELQADFDKKNAIASLTPEQYARQIATSKYGYSPEKAAGKFTADKFVQSKQTALDTQKYGEQAVGLAQKLNITGGAKRVAEILSDQEVIDDLDTLTEWSQAGDRTLDDAKRELGAMYLTGSNKDRDKYNVLMELTYNLPWKRAK